MTEQDRTSSDDEMRAIRETIAGWTVEIHREWGGLEVWSVDAAEAFFRRRLEEDRESTIRALAWCALVALVVELGAE